MKLQNLIAIARDLVVQCTDKTGYLDKIYLNAEVAKLLWHLTPASREEMLVASLIALAKEPKP